MPEITCNFIDCCSPDYLSDHHNRDNEALILACPDKDTEAIIEDFSWYASSAKIPFSIEMEQIDAAIKLMVDNLPIDSLYPVYYSESIDSDDDSEIYLYAYLSW